MLALAQLYKSYVINSGYDRPGPLMVYPILFQYLGFSTVALLFPFSWRLGGQEKLKRLLTALVAMLLFVALYLMILNALEWYALRPKFELWPAYPFTLLHSGPWVAVVYLAIAAFMLMAGLDKSVSEHAEFVERIPVKQRNETSYISVVDILYLESSDNYVSILTGEQRPMLVRQTLSSIENQLNPEHFQRVHRKYIVNLRQVQSWKADPNGGYLLTMPEGHQLKMSKSYKDKLNLITRKS